MERTRSGVTTAASPWISISPLTTNVSQIASTGTGLYILADTNWYNVAPVGHQVFQYTGSGTNSSWTPITGTNTNVSQITANGTGLFMLGNNGGLNQVWRYTGSGTNWGTITGTNTVVTQLTSTGSGVYMLAITGWVSGVWVYMNSGSNWSAVAAGSMGTSQLVSTGQSLYQLANSGSGNQVLEYTGTGTNWTSIAGTGWNAGRIAAAGSELFMFADQSGWVPEIWEYSGSGSNWTGQLDDPLSVEPDAPAPAGTPLYSSGVPYFTDVIQGQTGDCWLLASLAEVAARYPTDIKNMFIYDGNHGGQRIHGRALPGPALRAQWDCILRSRGHGLPSGGQ